MGNGTYRYFTGKPLYSFGYGLSNFNFMYSNAQLSHATIDAGDSLLVDVDVTNASLRNGDEVVNSR
jgi:beta-glucosidase